MIIKTQEDWWKLANETIPLIEDYILVLINNTSNKIPEKIKEAEHYIKDKDHRKLHIWFETLWDALPDRPDIRFGPFFDICDLCSEYWVFEESDD